MNFHKYLYFDLETFNSLAGFSLVGRWQFGVWKVVEVLQKSEFVYLRFPPSHGMS